MNDNNYEPLSYVVKENSTSDQKAKGKALYRKIAASIDEVKAFVVNFPLRPIESSQVLLKILSGWIRSSYSNFDSEFQAAIPNCLFEVLSSGNTSFFTPPVSSALGEARAEYVIQSLYAQNFDCMNLFTNLDELSKVYFLKHFCHAFYCPLPNQFEAHKYVKAYIMNQGYGEIFLSTLFEKIDEAPAHVLKALSGLSRWYSVEWFRNDSYVEKWYSKITKDYAYDAYDVYCSVITHDSNLFDIGLFQNLVQNNNEEAAFLEAESHLLNVGALLILAQDQSNIDVFLDLSQFLMQSAHLSKVSMNIVPVIARIALLSPDHVTRVVSIIVDSLNIVLQSEDIMNCEKVADSLSQLFYICFNASNQTIEAFAQQKFYEEFEASFIPLLHIFLTLGKDNKKMGFIEEFFNQVANALLGTDPPTEVNHFNFYAYYVFFDFAAISINLLYGTNVDTNEFPIITAAFQWLNHFAFGEVKYTPDGLHAKMIGLLTKFISSNYQYLEGSIDQSIMVNAIQLACQNGINQSIAIEFAKVAASVFSILPTEEKPGILEAIIQLFNNNNTTIPLNFMSNITTQDVQSNSLVANYLLEILENSRNDDHLLALWIKSWKAIPFKAAVEYADHLFEVSGDSPSTITSFIEFIRFVFDRASDLNTKMKSRSDTQLEPEFENAVSQIIASDWVSSHLQQSYKHFKAGLAMTQHIPTDSDDFTEIVLPIINAIVGLLSKTSSAISEEMAEDFAQTAIQLFNDRCDSPKIYGIINYFEGQWKKEAQNATQIIQKTEIVEKRMRFIPSLFNFYFAPSFDNTNKEWLATFRTKIIDQFIKVFKSSNQIHYEGSNYFTQEIQPRFNELMGLITSRSPDFAENLVNFVFKNSQESKDYSMQAINYKEMDKFLPKFIMEKNSYSYDQ